MVELAASWELWFRYSGGLLCWSWAQSAHKCLQHCLLPFSHHCIGQQNLTFAGQCWDGMWCCQAMPAQSAHELLQMCFTTLLWAVTGTITSQTYDCFISVLAYLVLCRMLKWCKIPFIGRVLDWEAASWNHIFLDEAQSGFWPGCEGETCVKW